MIKRLVLVLIATGSSLFAAGCVQQELWAAYIGASGYITAATTALLEQYLPF